MKNNPYRLPGQSYSGRLLLFLRFVLGLLLLAAVSFPAFATQLDQPASALTLTCASNKTIVCDLVATATNPPVYSLLRHLGTNGIDGQKTRGGLVEGRDGALYGNTYLGGAYGYGTVFKLNKDGSGYTVLRSFGGGGTAGRTPWGSLLEGRDGWLYGTTTAGGGAGAFGNVFKLSKDGSNYVVLHTFTTNGHDGQTPYAGLLVSRDDALYGTTSAGGEAGRGTVFKLNTDGSGYTVLRSFATNLADGDEPWGALIEDRNGVLYGTTRLGGNGAAGTVFKLNKDGSGYTVLRRFTGTGGDGSRPYGKLVEGTDGWLYGTTQMGGTSGRGTVFKLNPDGTGYAVVRRFATTGGDGGQPSSGLVEGWDGLLYGTCFDGGSEDRGTIYRLNKDGSGYATLCSFSTNNFDARRPFAGLVEGRDGVFYGMTEAGGTDNVGAIFRLELPCALVFDPPIVASTCCGGDNVALNVLSTVTNSTSPLSVTRTWQAVDCCTNLATCSQMVTVIDPQAVPVLTRVPRSRVVPIGEEVAFCVTATSSLPLSYQWSFNDTPIAGATNSTFNVVASVATEGNYSVRAWGGGLDLGVAAESPWAHLQLHLAPTFCLVGVTKSESKPFYVESNPSYYGNNASYLIDISPLDGTASNPRPVVVDEGFDSNGSAYSSYALNSMIGLEYKSPGNVLYAVTRSDQPLSDFSGDTNPNLQRNTLYQIDRLTGRAAPIGNGLGSALLGGGLGVLNGDLSFHPNSGVLYGVSSLENGSVPLPKNWVFTINLNTGVASPVGQVPDSTIGSRVREIAAVAFEEGANPLLVAVDNANGTVLKLDPSIVNGSGEVTVVSETTTFDSWGGIYQSNGPFGIAYGGMDYDADTQTFFTTNERSETGPPVFSVLQTFDPAGGTQSLAVFANKGDISVNGSGGCFVWSYKGGVSGLAVVPCACEGDLMVKDTTYDSGFEPNPDPDAMNQSQSIWVRRAADGGTTPEAPESGSQNSIHVLVHNRGCTDESGTLEMWWSPGYTGGPWQTVSWEQIGVGQFITVAGGSSQVVQVPWTPTYPGQVCLMARLVTPNGMTHTETANVTDNIRNNNNLASMTVLVVDLEKSLVVIEGQPVDLTAVSGSTVAFHVVARSDSPLTYQWRFIADVEGGDVDTLVGATNATLTLGNVQTNNAGRYDVVVSNPFHSVTSAPARLFMVPYAELVLNDAQHVENSGCCWEFDLSQHWGAPGNIAYIDLVVTTPGVTITSVSGPSPGPGSQAAVLLTSTSARWYMPTPNGLWNAGQTVTACFAGIPAGGADLVFRGYDAQGNTSTGNAAGALEQTTTIGGNGECACPPLVILKPLNATRYTCFSSAKVCYYASASGGCPPYTFTYSTPPCSTFVTGTMTPVTATVTDSKGNTASTTFTVKVLPAPNFWQWFAGGNPNCYMPPYVMPFRGACLNGAYVGPWKSFDIPTVNRRFGLTWNLPYGLYNGGYLYTRMKDFYCLGGAQDDTIQLGLQNCSPLWQWSKSLSSFGTPWCKVPQCGPLMVLNLGALPPGIGQNNVLPLINGTYPRRLDMMVEDDTRVDFAWLRLLRCPPQYMLGGIGLNLTNAELAHGPGTWVLAKDAVVTNGFTATLELGAASGVRLNFEQFTFANAAGGSLRILDAQHDRNIASLVASTNDTVSLRLGQPLLGVSNVVVQTLSNGVVIASNTLPATGGMELASFPAASSVRSLTVGQGGEFTCIITGIEWPMIINVTPQTSSPGADTAMASLTLEVQGFEQLTLGQPELRWVDPVDGQHDDWFTHVSGNAIAHADHGQLTLSALDAESADPIGFTLNLNTPTNELRATLATSFDMVAPALGNARLSLSTSIINGEDDEHDRGDKNDLPKLNFNHGGSLGWELTASASNAPLALASIELFHNGNSIVIITNPASVQVAGLPSVYAPSLKWMKGGICHGLLYSEAALVQIDGLNYTASEVRVMTAGNGPAPAALARIHVETTGIEALVLAGFATGPMRYRMEPPVVADGNIVIQGNPLGGVIQSAPGITGPWTAMPDAAGEVVVPLTNSPAQYFRIKGN